METGYYSDTFDDVGKSFAAFYNYTPPQRAREHQTIFSSLQQASALGNLQTVETKEFAETSVEQRSEPDFNNELDNLLSAAASLGNGFDRLLSSEASHRRILTPQPEFQPDARKNVSQQAFPSPSMPQNCQSHIHPQSGGCSVSEMVSGANLKNEPTTVTPILQEPRVVLLERQQELLSLVFQQNQNMIDLLQLNQCLHTPNDLQQSNIRHSSTLLRPFQDGNVPGKSTRLDHRAAHGENLTQIYADAERLTAVTNELPFSGDCAEPCQSSVQSTKSKERAVKLEATFKRIDAMYAALQRSQEEKAKRQQQKERHVKQSQLRSKLAPPVSREKFSEARSRDPHEDHLQLRGSSIPCQSVLQARSGGANAYGSESPSGPNHSSWDSLHVYDDINQPTGCPHAATLPEDFMASESAENAALAQESFLSTLLMDSPLPGYSGTKITSDYPTYSMQEHFRPNCGTNKVIDAQHEECVPTFAKVDDGASLVSGSPTSTNIHNLQNADPIDTFVYELFTDASKYGSMEYEDINELIDDFLSGEITRDPSTDSTKESPEATDNSVRIEEFASENITAVKSTTDIEARSLEKHVENSTKSDELSNWIDKNIPCPDSQTILEGCQDFQAAHQSGSEPCVNEELSSDASSIEPGLPNVKHIPEVDEVDFHVIQSGEVEMTSAQANALACTSSANLEQALDNAVSSSGVKDLAEQVRTNEFLLSEMYTTALLAFPDKQELTDAAMRTKFAHEFDNPNAISVFTSFIEGSLEENRELLESREKVLFFRTIDAQTSMVRERELGHPDLSELIERVNELTEVVGGYWPVSDKAVWMLGFMHANELRYFQSMMTFEWRTRIESASTSQDAAVCTFFGLRDLLIRFGDTDKTKNGSGLSKKRPCAEDTEPHVMSTKQKLSSECGAAAQITSSISRQRKFDHKEEEKLPSSESRSIEEDIDLFTGEGCTWKGIL